VLEPSLTSMIGKCCPVLSPRRDYGDQLKLRTFFKDSLSALDSIIGNQSFTEIATKLFCDVRATRKTWRNVLEHRCREKDGTLPTLKGRGEGGSRPMK